VLISDEEPDDISVPVSVSSEPPEPPSSDSGDPLDPEQPASAAAPTAAPAVATNLRRDTRPPFSLSSDISRSEMTRNKGRFYECSVILYSGTVGYIC
jgi:hypothetical protein